MVCSALLLDTLLYAFLKSVWKMTHSGCSSVASFTAWTIVSAPCLVPTPNCIGEKNASIASRFCNARLRDTSFRSVLPIAIGRTS